MEDKALASESLAMEVTGDSLESEFEKLESSMQDDAALKELEALKAKLSNN